MDDATRSFTSDISAERPDGVSRPVFTLLWSTDEPHRSGEIAALPLTGEPLVLGRTGTLRWVRARPGREEPTGDLLSPRISREQLVIGFDPEHNSLFIENKGRCPLLFNGRPTKTCTWVPGALLELEKQLLLRCEHRPALAASDAPTRHAFGGPDDWGIIGETPEAWEIRRQIAFCGPLDAHVLVRGPSGSGKELVARALHDLSRRRRAVLLSRNAATFPESLIDAELFGNAASYPNPGMPARPGLIGAADGGTLFLDEFGELSEAMQARLLRVLDAGEYTRLGDAHPKTADLRLVAATNCPLEAIKSDVLARLPLRILLPGLDVRRSDIMLLATGIVRRIVRDEPHLAKFLAGDYPRITLRLAAALVNHPYTVHVRELETLLWEAMREAKGDELDLWPDYVQSVQEEALQFVDAVDPESISAEVLKECLERHGGKQAPICRELRLSSRWVLRRLILKYNLG